MRAGWVGLGAMGGPMVQRALEQGHELVVYDLDPVAVAAAVGAGATAAPSPAAVASGADLVVVMVATPEQVEAVLFGEHGAATVLRPGSTVMVMATVGERAVDDWSARLGAAGVRFVDAPVSGGTTRARTGDLLVMVSGAHDAVELARPLLDSLAGRAPVVGDEPGVGQRVKLVNQLLCGVHIAAAAEALSFAESLGLDARATWEVIRHGAAGSFMLDDRGQRMLQQDPPVRSAIDIFVKDLGLVTEAAERSGQRSPIATAALEQYRSAHDAGWGRRDDSALFEFYRSGTG